MVNEIRGVTELVVIVDKLATGVFVFETLGDRDSPEVSLALLLLLTLYDIAGGDDSDGVDVCKS